MSDEERAAIKAADDAWYNFTAADYHDNSTYPEHMFNAGREYERAQQQKAEKPPERDPNICRVCGCPVVGASTGRLCPGPKDNCYATHKSGERCND